MARFTPQKFNLSDINGGERFENGQQPQQDAFNAPIEGSAYAIEQAENAMAKADHALNSIIPSGGTYPPLTAYPIGSIYISTKETSPAELFGGSWVKIKDKFLVGAGNLYALGATGGSADAVVVSHAHYVKNNYGDQVDYGGGYYINQSVVEYSDRNFQGTWLPTDYTGEDGTNKNLPPYLAVNIWERIA